MAFSFNRERVNGVKSLSSCLLLKVLMCLLWCYCLLLGLDVDYLGSIPWNFFSAIPPISALLLPPHVNPIPYTRTLLAPPRGHTRFLLSSFHDFSHVPLYFHSRSLLTEHSPSPSFVRCGSRLFTQPRSPSTTTLTFPYGFSIPRTAHCIRTPSASQLPLTTSPLIRGRGGTEPGSFTHQIVHTRSFGTISG